MDFYQPSLFIDNFFQSHAKSILATNFKQHLLHFYRLTYDFYINKFLKNFYSNFTSPTLFKYVIMNSFSCYDFFFTHLNIF